MVTKVRRFGYVGAVVALFAVVGFGLHSQVALAEQNNSFPGLENSSDWIVNANSPDPRLTYLYKSDGTINGKTTHILRNRTLGRNEGTRLRVYYKKAPQTVSVTVNVNECELEANDKFAGRVKVTLGGDLKYSQPTDGRKVDEQRDYYHWVDNGGDGARPYRLQFWKTEYVEVDRADSNSPVCGNYNGDYQIRRYNEGCNDANADGTRCAGVGNNSFSDAGKIGDGTVPPDGGTFGDKFAYQNRLNGKTFSTPFSIRPDGKMGYDTNTRLFYADLDIDLTSYGQNGDESLGDASKPANGADPAMMQRITFKVKGEDAFNGSTWMNARMGYRYFSDENNAARFFGLQGNGGDDNNTFPAYGQKHLIPFGPDCDGASRNGKITLYDPDRNGYGEVYMAVLRRNPDNGNVVQLNSYDNLEALVQEGNVLRSTAAGSGSRSSFTVYMEVGFQYMLAVYNPSQKFPPSSNVYSMRLPTDSMNGLVNCRYDLRPSTTNVKPTFSGYGDTLTARGEIVNNNPDAASGDHNWKISKVVYPSRPADLSRASYENSSITDPCLYARSKSGNYLSCTPDSPFNGTYPATESYDATESIGATPIGTYVCYFTSVLDPTWRPEDNNERRYSTMQCSVAGIKPKIQAWGYDTRATGRIKTSISEYNGRWYGSWGEYGLQSNGTNTNMASGNGLLGGTVAGFGQSSWSSLTFANDPGTVGFCGYGCFTSVTMPTSSTQGAVTRPSGFTVNSYADLVAAVGSNKGKIQVAGTLFINGDLAYPDSTTGITGLAKIELIAQDIVIGPNVRRIDPWLIARGSTGNNGRISTCSQVQQAGNYFVSMQNAGLFGGGAGICGNPLKFNSPVIADRVFLYRTFDQADGAQAAETFNVRADNFLRSYAGGGIPQPVATTTGVQELPPRF